LKVTYFFISDGNPNSGISKKVASEVRALRQLGVNIDIVATCQVKKERFLPKYLQFLKPIIRIQRSFEVREELRHCINSLGERDVLYFRIGVLPLPAYPRNFFKKFRRCKIVSEHQTIEINEAWTDKRYVGLLNEFLFGKFIRQQFSGTVSVTDEIRKYQIKKTRNQSISHQTIGNGFDVASVPTRTSPTYCGSNLNILFVGSKIDRKWYGLERLLLGLKNFRDNYFGNVSVFLHVVGAYSDESSLYEKVLSLNLQENVIFHGFVSGTELNAHFNQCHIAVGSLGIHRKGLTQTSELKGREYCARGIPYIIACDDPDFPADFPYILQLPADESPIDIKRVLAFAKEVCADPDHPQKMRRYAEEHLDWSVKMRELKDFLETLVGEDGTAGTPKPNAVSLDGKRLKDPSGTASSDTIQRDVTSGVSGKEAS
jgi:glycosyltransferase involved in cell wall biosynthesis